MESKYSDCIEAGLDEAGRGPLFGPVVACAVIWDESLEQFDEIKFIRDSKKLTKKRRKIAYEFLKEKLTHYGVGISTAEEIDEINILNATKLAMKRAIENLGQEPEFLIIDGVRWEGCFSIDCKSIIKGDDKYYSISAASIIAKEVHDEEILKLIKLDEALYSKYDLQKNMGYGTKKHMEAIKTFGPTEYHRKSFAPCKLN